MMLTKDCKKVLNSYIKVCDDHGEIFQWSLISQNTPKGFSKGNLINVLTYLQSIEYLTFEKNLNNEVIIINLSQKAIKYKEISFLELKTFLIKSVLIPIAVSTITTLVTIWIKNFL